MVKVAFLGLGVMGYPMAGHLQKAGHDVTVYNRTLSKAEHWAEEYNGTIGVTPAESVQNADFVFSCVGRDDDVRDITVGRDGAFYNMKSDSIFIDHTTTSADIARELDKTAQKQNIHFCDAPVSGGQVGADTGQLTIMIGCHDPIFQRIEPLMSVYAKRIGHMGPVGCGQLTKMVNQICITGLVQSLAEALTFAKRADLDVEKVVDVISKGAAQSWQMDNRWKTMVDDEFDFGFAVDWMRKDLSICLGEAEKNGSSLPVTALVDQFYKEIQALGRGRWDTSSLMTRLSA